MFLFGSLFFSGCNKTGDVIKKELPENISKQELLLWINNYQKLMPGGPKPILEQTLKTYFKGQMILKMPLSSGGGNLYFTKTDHLEVQFIRIVSADDQINTPFNGYYEFINMNTYEYKKIIFKQGIRQAEVNNSLPKQQTIKNTSAIKSTATWLGAFLYCLSRYVFAIPKRDINGNWGCYGPGGNGDGTGSSPEVVENINIGDSEGVIDFSVLNWFLTNPPLSYTLPPGPYSIWDYYDGSAGYFDSNNNTSYNFPSGTTTLSIQEKTDFLIYILKLSDTQQFFLINTSEAINTLFDYLTNNISSETIEIANWSIDYFSMHPDLDLALFKNRFLGKSEGYEGEYDSFWDNPNLTFPKQDLPSWEDFNNNFPKDSDILYNTSEKMFNSIGGEVATLYSGPKTNTCAIRLSKALNYSGVSIPFIPGQTYKGNDNFYYFKAAYQINNWMRKTFGTNPATSSTPFNSNHYSYNQTQAGIMGVNLISLLAGKKGIYSIYSSDFKWATGHADLLNSNSTCANNCHFADAPISRLDVWVLN